MRGIRQIQDMGATNRELWVHLLHRPQHDALEHLRSSLDTGIRLTSGPDLPVPADYDILVAGRPRREHLVASPSLRVLLIPWAGLPDTTRTLMQDFPEIAVHNLHHNALAVAEMAVTLLLAAAKGTIPADRALRANDWSPRYQANRPVLLSGREVLILGYGAVGREVGRVLLALGMRVVGVQRHPTCDPSGSGVEIHPPDDLHGLLRRAEVLVICLPQTAETTGLIGERELALLPPESILVNVGRGPVVDEAALYNALHTHALRAAGLDVWYDYPTDEASRSCTAPSAYPFQELENVVMSPHRAGHVGATELNRMQHLAVTLNAAAQGREIPHRVNIDLGY